MIHEIINAKSLHDFVFVRVPSRMNDTIGSFHLALSPKIVQGNFTPDDEVLDKPFNEEVNVRTSAMVIAAPNKLTPINLYEDYLGTPKYTPHISHEIIKDAILKMPEKLRSKYGRNMYYPGNPPESFQSQPNNPEIEVGDKIYFEYNVLLDESAFVERDNDGEVYKVPYQSIYCYVRNSKIHMVNGWVFVKSVDSETALSTIVLINNKPQPNVGEIAHIGKWLDASSPSQGERCLFNRTLFSIKEFASMTDNHTISGYEVEGNLYYPMRNWDIVAVEEDSEWVPVNDYERITPEVINVVSGVDTIVYDPKKIQDFKPGQIFIPENSQQKKKKIHNYGIGICNGDRVAYGKSNLYLYLDEFNLLFIHKNDVWGTFCNGQ